MTVRVTNSVRANLALTLGGRQLCDHPQKAGLPKPQGLSPQTGVRGSPAGRVGRPRAPAAVRRHGRAGRAVPARRDGAAAAGSMSTCTAL